MYNIRHCSILTIVLSLLNWNAAGAKVIGKLNFNIIMIRNVMSRLVSGLSTSSDEVCEWDLCERKYR